MSCFINRWQRLQFSLSLGNVIENRLHIVADALYLRTPFPFLEEILSILLQNTTAVEHPTLLGKSEVGILYLSDFNRKAIGKFLKSNQLEFHPLIKCEPYVYLWKGHPLAGQKSIRLEELRDYPCLSFEQGPSGAFYFAEEILSTYDYIRTIKATDRATMLNLMVGLNGYTLCSGIICEELNGSDYVAVAFEDEEEEVAAGRMEIGYIVKENMILSQMAEKYIAELKRYLGTVDAVQ